MEQADNASEDALVMSGGQQEIEVIMEETTSEMLQVARVSQISSIFPELNPGKAILRASQIMAKKLASDGVDPFLLLGLPEDVQQRIVNGVMRHAARILEPRSDEIGFRKVVKLIESTESIADTLGIKRDALPGWMRSCAQTPTDPIQIGALIGLPRKLLSTELVGS